MCSAAATFQHTRRLSAFIKNSGFTSEVDKVSMSLLNCEQEGQVLKCLRADLYGRVFLTDENGVISNTGFGSGSVHSRLRNN